MTLETDLFVVGHDRHNEIKIRQLESHTHEIKEACRKLVEQPGVPVWLPEGLSPISDNAPMVAVKLVVRGGMGVYCLIPVEAQEKE